MENSLALTMVFKDQNDIKTSVTVPNIKEGLTDTDIKAVMNSILSTGVLQGKNGPFVAKDSAYITAKEITEYTNVK